MDHETFKVDAWVPAKDLRRGYRDGQGDAGVFCNVFSRQDPRV
jgi:hypothetical protein